jgi:hypothetical protein
MSTSRPLAGVGQRRISTEPLQGRRQIRGRLNSVMWNYLSRRITLGLGRNAALARVPVFSSPSMGRRVGSRTRSALSPAEGIRQGSKHRRHRSSPNADDSQDCSSEVPSCWELRPWNSGRSTTRPSRSGRKGRWSPDRETGVQGNPRVPGLGLPASCRPGRDESRSHRQQGSRTSAGCRFVGLRPGTDRHAATIPKAKGAARRGGQGLSDHSGNQCSLLCDSQDDAPARLEPAYHRYLRAIRPVARSSKLYTRNLLRSDIHEEGSVKKSSNR